MGQKLVVGPFNKGLRNDRPPFMIDNENFPILRNAYQWRGRVKRKRGTQFLCRLQRFFNSTVVTYNPSAVTITFDGSGNGNIVTAFSLETNASIVPGTVTIVGSVGPITYTDPTKDGFLTPTGTGGANTINYASGAILIPAQAGGTATAIFTYAPVLPVMGLEDIILAGQQYPGTMGFDTKYSYNVNTTDPYNAYDVSFYKNPPTGTPATYTQKTNWTALTWNGQDYQQFWSTNYQGALFATNGLAVPFSTTNVGMPFKAIITVTVLTPTTATLNIATHGLVIGDFVFVNEVATTTGINFQTGYVTTVTDANNVIVTFPNAAIALAGTGGIAQYLTSRSSTTKDCIRWYDGDPTNASISSPTFVTGNGWVNFCPPLSQASYSIADLPPAQYYLVGARMILQFKDRLLFFGPIIQSSAGVPIYLQDTIIYSQNGTPYYTCSFSGNIFAPTGGFTPLLLPGNQTATPSAFWGDQTGFGGFISAGLDRAITTVSTNEDALIVGFDSNFQTRVIYSGNDIVPFNFFIINAEQGSSSTFSAINMDYGVITKGSRGYIVSSQTEVQRIDLEIPDEVFEVRLKNNGNERVCAQRDYINEWIYFTYPSNNNLNNFNFPSTTLQYNYRDQSWAIFLENYTTYGSFRKVTGFTWNTVGEIYPSWDSWTDPWDAGETSLLQPMVIGGNQQGFVLIRGEGIGEGTSLYIGNISSGTVTSPNHGLNTGDYILISGCLGTIQTAINDFLFQVNVVDANTFTTNPPIPSTGTYAGGGVLTRIYTPLILTKQFPMSWEAARKTRIGPQQYLLTTTPNGQITLQIYLNENQNYSYSTGPIFPDPATTNSALIYSQVLYTCPESTNLGLTAANVNLQMPTASQQAQIWHRINTSLIGDTVQLGFTLSDAQITQFGAVGTPIVITAASQAVQCILTCTAPFVAEVGMLMQINGVVGMTELNGNDYEVVDTDSATFITLDVDSTAYTPYISGGTAIQQGYTNLFNEIELHGFIMDLNPSQFLA